MFFLFDFFLYSGVAVSVSDSPMVEVYFLKGDLNPVRLWLDGADGVSFPYAQDNLKIEEGMIYCVQIIPARSQSGMRRVTRQQT